MNNVGPQLDPYLLNYAFKTHIRRYKEKTGDFPRPMRVCMVENIVIPVYNHYRSHEWMSWPGSYYPYCPELVTHVLLHMEAPNRRVAWQIAHDIESWGYPVPKRSSDYEQWIESHRGDMLFGKVHSLEYEMDKAEMFRALMVLAAYWEGKTNAASV